MRYNELLKLRGFYENELKSNILSFWMPRCLDTEYGGYLNCFDNEGRTLMSHDKYTWSQGRFVWMFARLATIDAPLFSKAERERFLTYAKSGRDFLMAHCLMDTPDVRCTFLMERDGTPKFVPGCDTLDMSIYADCFVVIGMNAYADAAQDKEAYAFAKKVYRSIVERISSGRFNTLPYPLSPQFRAHGIPMILTNVTAELLECAKKFDPDFVPALTALLEEYSSDVLEHFADENGTIHEVISAENEFIDGLLGQHANPGHTIEDMWFQLDAAKLLNKPERMSRILQIALRAFVIGWDEEYKGLLHYVSTDGENVNTLERLTDEVTENQVAGGWGDKLWWIHSEALYTSLRCYLESGDEAFYHWHEKVFKFTFKTFPNRDPEIREWKQICMRDGSPQEKVVALPVKDPFHISRNLILIIELLDRQLRK